MRRAIPNRSVGKASKSKRWANGRHLALQPDAQGVATRLAAGRLRGPLHDRSSPESGSPSVILLCRKRANSGLVLRSKVTSLDHLVGTHQH
jgi:hypothetical protein